jgi:hypothetical protein
MNELAFHDKYDHEHLDKLQTLQCAWNVDNINFRLSIHRHVCVTVELL